MVKRSLLMRLVTILLAVALLVSVPYGASAGGPDDQCPSGTCPGPARIKKTEDLPNGLKLVHLVDDEGTEYRVATKTQEEGNGKRMEFWVIQNDAELQTLLEAVEARAKGGSALGRITAGYVGLPAGGWIYWDSNTIRIYISHDLAVLWATGFGIVAIICGIITLLPMGALPGAVCSFIGALSAAVIIYYDEYGSPGFYVVGTLSPLQVWVEP